MLTQSQTSRLLRNLSYLHPAQDGLITTVYYPGEGEREELSDDIKLRSGHQYWIYRGESPQLLL